MARILCYTITRADSIERGRLLNSTLTIGRETAGIDFDWHVYCNGGQVALDVLEAAKATGVINSYDVSSVNMGQHPHVNSAHTKAINDGYDYVVRTDDDVEWLSKRWLAKLVEASQRLDNKMVLSPMVKGLRWQPPQSEKVEVEGIPLKFIEGPIGGICRLTPVQLLRDKPYVSDIRLPMGGGDAGGVGKWATSSKPIIFLAYCQHIRVRHAKSTEGQEVADPGHFDMHGLYQHVPYIPIIC